MPIRLLVVTLLVWAALLPDRARAQGNEPTVYLFWARSCPHSQRAITFIHKYRQEEPKLAIQDFEVDGSPANAAAHLRVLERIGISGVALVPLIVVGENVLVGFETDEGSGARVRAFVQECRTKGCPDRMRDLLPQAAPDWAAMALVPPSRSCAGSSRVERLPPP